MKEYEKLAIDYWKDLDSKGIRALFNDHHIFDAYEVGFRKARELAAEFLDDQYVDTYGTLIRNLGENEVNG